MFLRKLKNRSGSISVQIISKDSGKYKVIKTIGSGSTEQEVQKLIFLGKQEMERLSAQGKFFV
ncbi:MAG: IS1634 family transposase, partial [Bacteroidota bacterium]